MDDFKEVLTRVRIEDYISNKAGRIAKKVGAWIDGGHHKQWLIDQLVRILTGNNYDKWVAEWEYGEDGAHTYEWDTGIAP